MTVRTTSENVVEPGSPAGTRAARPAERRGPVRPGGRRAGSPLPPARPVVRGGSARAGGAGPAGRPPATVVRRRRVAALLLATVLSAVAVLVLVGVSSQADAAEAPASAVTVVRVGETLQDVARRTSSAGDEQAVAARIRELNGLPSSNVAPGRPLLVPAG